MKKKEIVRLREKKIANGNRSLYLDIYLNGKRTYEFLQLYLLPETRQNKEENKRTLQLAESVKAQRIIEIQNKKFGFIEDYSNTSFIEVMKALCEMKNKSSKKIYTSVISYLSEFDDDIRFSDFNKKLMDSFLRFLQSKNLKATTISTYISKIKAVMNYAVSEELILKNPIKNFKYDKGECKERNYLTISELRKFSKYSGKYKDTWRMFMFSCLTGLRYSDIVSLTWSQIVNDEIVFIQKKTGKRNKISINSDAFEILSMIEKKSNAEKVFKSVTPNNTNIHIKNICQELGIEKEITFHCARHTFATLLITQGVDLFVVSKLLGHQEISTTQIYAKLVDSKRKEAIEKIPPIL